MGGFPAWVYSRACGDRAVASTRVKDLVDLVLIAGEPLAAGAAAPAAGRLEGALRSHGPRYRARP